MDIIYKRDKSIVGHIKDFGFLPACAFEQVFQSIQRWNANAFPLLKALGFAETFEEFFKYQAYSNTELEKEYIARYIAQGLATSETERGKRVQALATFESTKRDLPNCKPWYHPVTSMGAYKAAFVYSNIKGVGIDKEKFLEIYKSNTEAKQSEIHQHHQKIINDLNTFFPYVENWEQVQRYIKIENGKFAINQEGVTVESYMQVWHTDINTPPKNKPKRRKANDTSESRTYEI